MTFKENGPQTKLQLDQMITNLRSMNINAPLVWLWVWDSIVDIYNQHSQDNFANEYTIKEGITLDKIFEDLWANPPADFTLEYGTDQLDEAILDWMTENEYMVSLDEDGWLDEVEEVNTDQAAITA
jgi:hypothetical protein